MGLTFEPLGKYVHLIDERNTKLVTESVLGINIDKYFMPSVANVIGTDLGNYKVLRKGRFACNPMHVGRDGRLPVARYMHDDPAIVSPAYFMFEIIDENYIDPEYLMLCFRRPDFDRMCWFRTDASVRGGITWEDVCALTIPIPSRAMQETIVRNYLAITNRIKILKKICSNLEVQEDTILSGFLENMNDDWSEGFFSDLIINTIPGDWGSDVEEGNNHSKVTCIRGTDIPGLNNGLITNAPIRYILNKNFSTKRLPTNSLIIEISGGSPTQSTGRIALLTEELNSSLENRVICSNFCKAIQTKDEYLYYFYLLWRLLYKSNRLFDYENSTIGLKNFDFQSFTTQETIMIPDTATAIQINNAISPIRRSIIVNGYEIEKLMNLQANLLENFDKIGG